MQEILCSEEENERFLSSLQTEQRHTGLPGREAEPEKEKEKEKERERTSDSPELPVLSPRSPQGAWKNLVKLNCSSNAIKELDESLVWLC